MNYGTIFLDIDGTIIKHGGDLYSMITKDAEIIEGTIQKLIEWKQQGYNIILTTARPEGTRKQTEQQLSELGIFYHRLIINLSSGPRVVINDTKPDGTVTAIAHPIKRNSGIKNIQL